MAGTTMDECEHGSLPNMCPVEGCENEAWAVIEEPPPLPSQPVVEAAYTGSCVLCPDPIEIGDFITATVEGWAHKDCT